MKRSLFTKFQKGALLAVPAAALMLGAAQAQTTIGLNFMAWYYDSGTTPQTVGYGKGYQTSGWFVTATAFGVPASNWYGTASPDLLDANFVPIADTYTFGPAGALSATLNAPGVWQTGIGEQVNGWNPETVAPGNDQVTWNYLTSSSSASPSVSITGLAAQFPHGYALQTIAAYPSTVDFNGLQFSDGTTTSHADYSTYYETSPASDGYKFGGTIGLSAPSGTFTGDAMTITCDTQSSGSNSVLSAFIISDTPVLTRNVPSSLLFAVGATMALPPPSIVGVGLTYQWQHAGTNLPGATSSTYSQNALATTDSGLYQVVVSSTFFPSVSVTAQVANVSVVPPHAARVASWDADTTTSGAQDGPGIWSNSLVNWWSGTIDDFWGAADSAVFGAGGTNTYKVTLGDNITANSITFKSGAYILTNSSGQTLTLQGVPALIANTNGTITVPLTITTNVLLKTGTGAVTVSGSLTGTNVFVAAGTLAVLAKNGDATYVVTNGSTLKIGYSTIGGYANTAMQLYGDGAAATTGLYLKGGTTYNVSGGVLVNSAPTTIRQFGSGLASIGTFDINGTPGLSISAAASGSATDPNIQIVSSGYGMVITTAAGANTATGDLVINGPLNVPTVYGLLTEGQGSVRLNGVATSQNGALNIMGGSVICGAANCVGTNALLNVGAVKASGVSPAAGTVFDLNGTSQTVSNMVLAGTLKMTINKGGSPNCNTLNCWGQPATLSGTLEVNNIGGNLALGDSFTLFPTPAGSGFTNLVLPAVGNGLAWQDNSTVDGTIKVIVGSVPPSIVNDLSGSTNYAYVGGSFTFAIGASGDPTLRYQWKLNGTRVVGSDSPTLTLAPLTLAATGNYSCTVTNNFGVAQSQTNYLLVSAPTGYVATVMNTGPTAFWPLDEADGTTAFDVFGNYDATYLDGYTQDYAVNPATGTQGVEFDGFSGKVLTAYAPGLNPAIFTAAAWVNPDYVPSSEYCVLSCGQFASPRSGWLIYQFPGYWDLRTYNGNGTTVGAEVVGVTAPTPGTWEHLAVSWDGTTARLYVNGVLEGSKVSTATPNYAPGASGGFCVGARADSSFYFPGTVSDAVFYNRVLVPQEISALALIGPPISTTPTKVTASASAGYLNLSWPLDHTGWQLLVQTNHLAAGISSNPNDWGTVTGANTTNQVSIPISATQAAAFYQLVYP